MEIEEFTATSNPNKLQEEECTQGRTRHKVLSIELITQMWFGVSIHEAIATQRGTKLIEEKRTDEDFLTIGTPDSEVEEFRTLRRAFPRVPRRLYPHERPDAVPGHYLHFTQLPQHDNVNQGTGLSEAFHIAIRFENGFKNISRSEAKGACLERLRTMNIQLGTDYANPLDIGLNIITKNWAGFIKLHLKYPHKDGITLLKGERALVMEEGEKIIGKVEKDFELATKARNLRLRIKGDTLQGQPAHDIFKSIVRESYYAGGPHEFLTLTKPDTEKDFAFLTLTTEEARDAILKGKIKFNHENLTMSITRDREAGNSSELRISTTLVINNLPQKESQSNIVKTLERHFGEDNIVGVSFGHPSNHKKERQYGWCRIQCLNAAVYTEWVNKSAYTLGRRIDFMAHKGSIDGS